MMRFDVILCYTAQAMKKTSKNPTVSQLFFQGNHQAVVDQTLDSASGRYKLADFPCVVGALSFLGRYEEGEKLFLKEEEALSEEQRVECRFFLGLGFCRHSFYEKARQLFCLNLLRARRLDSATAKFYAHQGAAFYRLTFGEYKKCLKDASKAHYFATTAQFGYGKILATDIQGHALVQTGKVAQGIQSLKQASQLAAKHSNKEISEIIPQHFSFPSSRIAQE